jgi:hypothetical protein
MDRFVKLKLARHITVHGFSEMYSDHDDLTLETLLEFPMEDWDWSSIMFHRNFRYEWIKAFIDKPWPWHDLHLLPGFKVDWVYEMRTKPLDWYSLSRVVDIHSVVIKVPDKPWDWRLLSMTVPTKILVENKSLPWDWSTATILGDVTVSDMCRYPDLPWDIDNLLFGEITQYEIEYIMTFRHRFEEAHWNDFSHHVSWDLMIQNLGLPWVFSNVRFNRILTRKDFECIQSIGFGKFDWVKLTQWVDCDVIVEYNYYPWDWMRIHMNDTLVYRHLERIHCMRWEFAPCEPTDIPVKKWHSACIIQRQYRACTTNPEYAMCRQQIQSFLGELEQYLVERGY